MIGFIPQPKAKESTIYDRYLGKNVNIDVAGGVGGTGTLRYCEFRDGGYQFRLSPYFSSSGNKVEITTSEEPKTVSAYASLSISVLTRPLEEIVAEINKKKKKSAK